MTPVGKLAHHAAKKLERWLDERWIAGVDGCRAGWFTVLLRFNGETVRALRHRLCARFHDVLALPESPAAFAVDIPIGLLDEARPGGRVCDREARQLLNQRKSSVFSPPVRAALAARNYADALARNRAAGPFAQGISRQTWNILPKIREVNPHLSPKMQSRVLECHPELTFLALGGQPARYNKKCAQGRAERIRLLAEVYDTLLPDPTTLVKHYGRNRLSPDDVVDACALALTAHRIQCGVAMCLPKHGGPVDGRGLRMEIHY